MILGRAGVVFSALIFLAGPEPARAQSSLELNSSAFAQDGSIPAVYTCTASDKSPPLSWSKVPATAKTVAIVVEDPDAPVGNWVHWVIYDLPAHVTNLPEGFERTPTLPDGTKQGTNGLGRIGYNGPCPPPGRPHHYHFRLFALDSALGLKPGATAAELKASAQRHIVGTGELVGVFGR